MSAAAVARDRRSCGDCAVSRSRSCCMRPSRRPLRFRSCSSRARQPPSLCCAIVPMLAAGACRCLRIMICSAVVLSAQPSSPIVPLFILRRSIMPCSHKQRRTCSAVAFASSVFGMSQLVLHEKNGLLEIFLFFDVRIISPGFELPARAAAAGGLPKHRRDSCRSA